MREHKLKCLVIGDHEDPVVAVHFTDARTRSWDSGYRVFTKSAPLTPAEAPDEDDEDFYSVFCLQCLAKNHPEAERGLKLARAYGSAWWDEDEGGWMAEDEDGNEVVFDSGDQPLEEAER